MPNKKQPENKKVLDISRPKKRPASGTAVTGAPSLVIPKRTVINPTTVDETTDNSQENLQLKHVAKGIEPASAPEVATAKAEDTVANTSRPLTQEPATGNNDTTPAAAVKASPEPVQKPSTTKPTPEQTPEADVPTDAATAPSEEVTPDATDDTDSENKSPEHPDVRKALEEAKRQEQLQGYIEKREFFVPINAVAKKRSLKVTIALIIIEVILGLFLLNLMLDAGLIYLLQKIPHTHFFNLQ